MSKHRRKSAGRPRKTGDRYPNGKLKIEKRGPNEATLAHRKAICADPTMASCPLDAAFANGWLTFEEHLAGSRFARLYQRSGIGMRTQVTASAGRELPEGTVDLRGLDFREMTDSEIGAVWDSAMRDVADGPDDGAESRQGQALALYKAVNAAILPGEQFEVFRFCVQEQWPKWLEKRIQARDLRAKIAVEKREPTKEEARDLGEMDNSVFEISYKLLVNGLRTIARTRPTTAGAREPDRPVTAIPGPRPAPTPPSHGRDEFFQYVDSKTSEPLFEVVKVRRRPKSGSVPA